MAHVFMGKYPIVTKSFIEIKFGKDKYKMRIEAASSIIGVY